MPKFKLMLTAYSDREESLAIASIPPGQQFNPPLPAKLIANQSNPVSFGTSISLKDSERVVLIFRDSKSGELHQAGLTYENGIVRPYLSAGSAALATIAIWPQMDGNYQGKIDLGIVGSTPPITSPLNPDPRPDIGGSVFHRMEPQKFQASAGQTSSQKTAPVEAAMSSPTSAETFPDAFRPFHETMSPPTAPTATPSNNQAIVDPAFSIKAEGFSPAPTTVSTRDKAIQDKAIQDKAIQDKTIQDEVTTEIQPPTVFSPQSPETKPAKADKKL